MLPRVGSCGLEEVKVPVCSVPYRCKEWNLLWWIKRYVSDVGVMVKVVALQVAPFFPMDVCIEYFYW